MNGRSTVTVLIPSYNYARYLPQAVESAVHQEGVDHDVVIVDNASTDGSLRLAQDLAASYERVRVVSHLDNQGIVSSFNRCLAEPRGDYTVMLCADDCLTPGSLQRSVAFMDDHPAVGLAYGPLVHFRSHEVADVVDQVHTRRTSHGPIVYSGTTWIGKRCESGQNPIRAPEALMRTTVQRASGLYDPRCPYTFDLNMWLRIAARSDVAYLPGRPQAFYRLHGDNYSNTDFGTPLPDVEQHWAAFKYFLESVDDAPDADRWARTVRQTMARRARWAASRVFAGASSPSQVKESEDLLALARSISGHDLSRLDSWNWAVQRKIGSSRMWWYPPFTLRFAVRGFKRYAANRRQQRTGV